MRLLFVTNFYPPFARGGYEQWCDEVAVELTRRGHVVTVLSSRPPGGSEVTHSNELAVHRLLHLEVESGLLHTAIRLVKDRERLEKENLDQLRSVMARFEPDAVLIWGMWNVPRAVPATIEQLLPGRVAYYLCDYWPSLPGAYVQQWQAPSARMITGWAKKLIGLPFLAKLAQEPAVALRLEQPMCVSRAVRDILTRAGVPMAHARIVHGGTQVDDFTFTPRDGQRGSAEGLKLLYAGRLTADKGVHAAILALSLLPDSYRRRATLSIVGGGDGGYERWLKALTRTHRLEGRVVFLRSVPRSEMPAVFAGQDVLVFPSEWEEPFARIVLEAMAAGLVVIGTTTGGTGEVLVDGETGLTFPPGDAVALAERIQRLLDDPALGLRLAEAGRRCVEGRFSFRRMVDEIETALLSLGEPVSASPAIGQRMDR